MIDALVDRIKGRRRVRHEGACEVVGDFYVDEHGAKWLCVASERDEHGLVLDLDETKIVVAREVAKKAAVWFVGFVLTAGSIVAPLYWFFWRNS